MSQPFNPLDRLALARSIEHELLERPCSPLPPPTFEGAGVYAIYYSGDVPFYAPISSADCERPIYVGKTTPPGGRTGGFLDSSPGRVLADRLRQHANSIDQAGDLDLGDFRCRHIVLEDTWIGLGEAVLISHTRPVWNFIVSGFGKHTSGAGRTGGRRSLWDELHPGRPWAAREQPSDLSRDGIIGLIEAFFSEPMVFPQEPVEE